MAKKSTILGGTLLLTGSSLLLRLLFIAFQSFLSGRIGAAGMGLVQLVAGVGGFAMLVGTAGVRIAAMNLCAEEFGHRRLGSVRLAMRTCLRFGAAVSAVAGITLFLLADWIAAAWLRDIRVASSLRVLGLLLPFSCLCGIYGGYFTACGQIRRLITVSFVQQAATLLLTAAALLLRSDGSLGTACLIITFGSGAGAVLGCVCLSALARRSLRAVPLQGETAQMRKRLLRLCLPLSLNDTLRAGLNMAEQLIIPYGLTRYGGDSTAAMASYGTLHAMVFPVLMFPAAALWSLSDLLVPELSRSRAMGRRLRIVTLTDRCLRMGMLFSAAVAGLLLLNAEALGQLLFHSAEAGRLLRIFAPMVLMLYLDALVDGMLKGMAQQIPCVRYNTFTSLLDVVLLFWLLPRHGVGGFVFSFTLTHAINLFLSLRRLLLCTAHHPKTGDFLLPLASLGAALACTIPVPFFGKSAVFIALLLCFSRLSRALRREDIRWLRGLLGLRRAKPPAGGGVSPRLIEKNTNISCINRKMRV